MYLHNQTPPIIHHGLKSNNILVHETFQDASNIEQWLETSADLAGGSIASIRPSASPWNRR